MCLHLPPRGSLSPWLRESLELCLGDLTGLAGPTRRAQPVGALIPPGDIVVTTSSEPSYLPKAPPRVVGLRASTFPFGGDTNIPP